MTDPAAAPFQEEGAWEYFYERTVPEPDELVMVRVNSIDDMGVLCSLLEFNNLEGFLPLSELSRKRMRSVLRHVRVGQKQILQVLRVDTERGYVDLSKKYIGTTEKEEGMAKYEKSKHVHSITKRLAELTHRSVKSVYETMVWPLYNYYKHPFDAFKALASEDENIFDNFDEPIPDDLRESLKRTVLQRMAVQPVKLGAQIEVTCYAFGGIEEIKDSLRAGLEAAGDQEVHIQLISSPAFLIWTTTTDEEKGCELLNSIIKAVQTDIARRSGNCVVIKEPHVLGKEMEAIGV